MYDVFLEKLLAWSYLFEGRGHLDEVGQEGSQDVVHGHVLVAQQQGEGNHLAIARMEVGRWDG